MSNYLRGEKPEVGNHNAAWSSQTGKGLLYLSKTKGENPTGIINLVSGIRQLSSDTGVSLLTALQADITDIKEDGTVDFIFHSHGHKHVFQATNTAERDAWVAALKTQSAEAKESSAAVTESEKYKETITSLKPIPAPVAAKAVEPKKEEEKKEETPAVAATTTEATPAPAAVEEKKEESKEEKKARTKSRSASRKRASIFGSFGLGKKSEEVVPKVEKKEEAAPATTEVAAAEPTAPASEDKPVEAAAPVSTEPVVETTVTAEETRPAPSKRHSSLFDFKSRFGSKKAAEAPAVPAKDEEPVTSAEAPVIPAVEQSEPLATSIASPATVPTETTKVEEPVAADAAETKVETKPEVKSERRKSSLPFGFGKKEKATSGDEAEKPSPFAKLRQTIKGKKSEKPAETKAEEEKKEEVAPVVAAEEKKADEPAAPAADAEPKKKEEEPAAAPAATPVVAATA